MRKTASIILGLSTAALLFGTMITAPTASAQGAVPSKKVCEDKENPPKEAAIKGGCVAVDRRKGNCHTCHAMNGTSHGNVAPPLVAMKARFPDKDKLRKQVWDATIMNPNSVMPPFGRHGILSEEEVDNVVEFLLTL